MDVQTKTRFPGRWRLGALESPLLRWVLRIVGVTFVVYSVAAMPLLAFTSIGDEANAVGQFVSWGNCGLEYQVMLCAVDIGIGLYLVFAGRDPVQYRHVIDLFLVAQGLHMISMFIMGFATPMHHMHVIGDVPVATLSVLTVAFVWLPVRKKANIAARQ